MTRPRRVGWRRIIGGRGVPAALGPASSRSLLPPVGRSLPLEQHLPSPPGEPGARAARGSQRLRLCRLEPRTTRPRGGDASPRARVRSVGLSSPHPSPVSRGAAYPHPTRFLGDPAESSRPSQTPSGAAPRPRELKVDPEQKSGPQAWAVVGIHFEPRGWLRVAPEAINPLRILFCLFVAYCRESFPLLPSVLTATFRHFNDHEIKDMEKCQFHTRSSTTPRRAHVPDLKVISH